MSFTPFASALMRLHIEVTRTLRTNAAQGGGMKTRCLAVLAAGFAAVLQAQVTPDFGPNVTIFDSTTPRATIQATLDSVFRSQETSQLGERRVALLFKPGTYDVAAS